MKRISKFFVSILILFPIVAESQTATEAFRLSTSDPMGTARNLGVGNSMFAIGPDFSAIGSNPAGLGGYGKSEFVISANFDASNFSSYFTTDLYNKTRIL